MITTTRLLGVFALSVLSNGARAQNLESYMGSISSVDGTLVGSGPWAYDSEIAWVIMRDGETWKYQYEFTMAQKDISHIILERETCIFEPGDIVNFSEETRNQIAFEYASYSSESNGQSNPGMPYEMYGIKMDIIPDTTSILISFLSDNAPEWGDVYLKDGKNGGNNVYAYNSGFTVFDSDPMGQISDGSLNGHILVPGCVSTGSSVPEPSSVILLGTLGVFGLLKRRR